MTFQSVSDYRQLAKKRLPHFLFEYLDGGSLGEITMNRNRRDLESVVLRQRVLRDVSHIDTSLALFGQHLSMPVALGPIGLAGMYARRGETQAAKAAEAAGVPFTLSTVGLCSVSEVAAAVEKPFWFQLYMIRDRAFMRDMLSQASQAGCNTLFLTVDMPVPGIRYRDYRSGLAGADTILGGLRRIFQAAVKPRWAWDVGIRGRPHQLGNVAPVLGSNSGLEDFMAWMANNFDPAVTWETLEFIRDNWKGRIILKGILDVEDAQQAAQLQLDGIIVSNHGGRQLDGVSSTAKALPKIADAVGDRITILADGGVSSGLDVIRLLALGAQCVLLGRSWVYALSANGQSGVSDALEVIRRELHTSMALAGCATLADIDRKVLQ